MSDDPYFSLQVSADERDAFEKWAEADNRSLDPEMYEDREPTNFLYYIDDTTNHAYIGWCARAALPAEIRAREEAERERIRLRQRRQAARPGRF